MMRWIECEKAATPIGVLCPQLDKVVCFSTLSSEERELAALVVARLDQAEAIATALRNTRRGHAEAIAAVLKEIALARRRRNDRKRRAIKQLVASHAGHHVFTKILDGAGPTSARGIKSKPKPAGGKADGRGRSSSKSVQTPPVSPLGPL